MNSHITLAVLMMIMRNDPLVHAGRADAGASISPLHRISTDSTLGSGTTVRARVLRANHGIDEEG